MRRWKLVKTFCRLCVVDYARAEVDRATAALPTKEAYDAACKALWKWRDAAATLEREVETLRIVELQPGWLAAPKEKWDTLERERDEARAEALRWEKYADAHLAEVSRLERAVEERDRGCDECRTLIKNLRSQLAERDQKIADLEARR